MHGKIMDGRALVVRLRSEGGRLGGGGGGGERPSRGFAPGENDESKARPARRRSEAGPRVGQAARKRAALRPRKGAPPRAAGRPPGALWSLLPAQSGGPACWAARGGGTSRRPKVAQSPDAICAARGLDSHWMVRLRDRAAHREAAHTAEALPHLYPRSLLSPSGPGSPGLTPGRRGAAQVYVAHLSHGANEEQLHRLFSDFGEVVNVRMIVDRDTGQPKGYAFVTMASPAQAQVPAARSASPGRPRPRPAVHSSRGPLPCAFHGHGVCRAPPCTPGLIAPAAAPVPGACLGCAGVQPRKRGRRLRTWRAHGRQRSVHLLAGACAEAQAPEK